MGSTNLLDDVSHSAARITIPGVGLIVVIETAATPALRIHPLVLIIQRLSAPLG